MMKSLLKQWSALAEQHQAVLCSVIEWKGSVPRKDFPLMLVLDDGSILGTIGGGSMELKVTKIALEMIHQPSPQVLDFDMTGNDVEGDLGLCGGTLKVLVEPFDKALQAFLGNTLQQMSSNSKMMVKISIKSNEGIQVQRELIGSRQDIVESDPELQQQIQSYFKNQKTLSFEYGDSRYLIWQPFSPPLLHIFGAGHVGQAVAELAHFNELKVVVYDDRMELLTAQRFPAAQRIETTFPINWESIPAIDPSDFVLIASREHKHDRELLNGLLRSSQNYIGLVSSARKWKLLSESLLADGIDGDVIAKVHAPVGIDISAQTVPEIAISIVSEIIAEYRSISN